MAEIMYVDWDGLVYYDTRSKQYIKDIVDQTIKFGGYYTFEDVPAPGFETLHVAYKITDKFVVSPETAYFLKTCAGKTFEAGTVILVVEDGESDTYRFDILFEAHSGTPLTPEGELDLSNYYTRAQVDDLLSGKVNAAELDRYYLKTETDNLLADKANKADLNGLATEEFVVTTISAIEIPEAPTRVSELENDAGYITEHQDISGKADVDHKHTLADIEDYVPVNLEPYALKTDVPSVEGLATETFVKNAIAEAELNDKEVDLTGYATKDELSAVEAKIPSLEGLATETFVTEAINNIPEADLSNYYNKTETENLVNDAVKAISVPEVPTNVSAFTNDAQYTTLEEVALQGYLTEHQDLSEYAKSSDVDAIEENVNGLIATVTSNSSSIADIQDAVDDNTTAIASIQENVDTIESDIIDLKTKTTATDRDIEILRTQLVTKTSQLENDSGYLTEATLPDFVQPDEVKDLVTLADVEAAGFIKSFTVPEEYVTESELDEKGFITDISGKADIDHTHSYKDLTDTPVIPSVDGLASEEYVDQAIANIDVPEAIDTSKFVTTDSLTSALATKANDVPFVDDYRVGTDLGGFVADESLQGMTVVQILTKLLNLNPYIPPVAGLPEGTTPTVENIIVNEVPMYVLSNAGTPVTDGFEYKTMTVEEGARDNQNTSFMYQIVDEASTVVESGYQVVTEELDEGYLTIYVPETITNFSIRIFDGIGGSWVTPEWKMIENSGYQLDGYKVYTADPSYDIYERMTIRVVIEN